MQNKFIEIDGANMHYLEMGQGYPILFLHSMPLSSHLWRNVMPHLAALGRCIAPDFIGVGLSSQPEISYSIADHIYYINALIEKLQLKKILVVMHGWGSIIGCDYAMRHEKNCRGLVFYEAFLQSIDQESISLPYQEQVTTFQDPAYLLEIGHNPAEFVEKILSQYSMQELAAEQVEHYRNAFNQPLSHSVILQYIKDLPDINADNKVTQIIQQYSEKLTRSNLPKLMLYTVPGLIASMTSIMWAKEHLPNLEVIDIGEELHLIQETSPSVMGETISVWLQALEEA